MTSRSTLADRHNGDNDAVSDRALRPQSFTDFVGQSKLTDNLKIFVQAARGRAEPLDHVLLYGPPGLGKTTLAHILASELGVNIHVTSGPVLEKPGDLAAILTTQLADNDVLFIDEIHRLPPVVEEILYPAMEDYKVDVLIGKGAGAQVLKLSMPPFTLIGATTRTGLLTAPLRSRFGVDAHFNYYDVEALEHIIIRSAKLLKVPLEPDAAHELARRARGTPRIANRLLRRVRDFAEVQSDGRIALAICRHALEALEVDAFGLDNMDRRILEALIHKYHGGPVGIETLAVAVSEEPDTLSDVYEPFLIQCGFIERTPRGRVACGRAFDYLGVPAPAPAAPQSGSLFEATGGK